MSEPSWSSWEHLKAAYLCLVYAHVPYEKDAAGIVAKSTRTVSDFGAKHEVYFTKPLKARGPILPPAKWLVELMQFLRGVRRTGKVIQLPRELLLGWPGRFARKCCVPNSCLRHQHRNRRDRLRPIGHRSFRLSRPACKRWLLTFQ